MYVEKGKLLSQEEIRAAVDKSIDDLREYNIRLYRRLKHVSNDERNQVALELSELNAALASGRDVWATCEKEPRGNLDSGRHYYQIHYINPSGHVHTLYLREFSLLLGGYENKRYNHLGAWLWSSGAIGMSRLLNATDGVFSYLRRLGGCYAQIREL